MTRALKCRGAVSSGGFSRSSLPWGFSPRRARHLKRRRLAAYTTGVRSHPAAPQRILVMMLGDVGDVLLATPALRELHATFPAARITAMTKPTTIAVLRHSGLVDGFLPVEKHLFDRPAALLHPAVALRMVRYVLT